MAESVISIVVQNLGNLLKEEGTFLHEERDQIKQLQAELERLQALLRDADARQNEDEFIRVCVSQARDHAYEAEDLLERYAFKVGSRRRGGVISIIKRCFCLLDECFTRHQIGSEIKSLKAQISDLINSLAGCGIIAMTGKTESSSSRQQQLRRTHSHVVEEDLVGVESQVEMLVENITGDKFRFVSIYGMGGLGKTTLARKVYQHPKVKHHFEVVSWICVSQQWQTRDLLQGISTKFMPEKKQLIKEWRDEELVRELFEFQKNRKCLVVLDDVWSTDVWDCIKDAFSIREAGSKVLLTTRNKEVAIHISASGFYYQPKFLSPKKSWELLRRKSLIQSRTQVEDEEIQKMEELGEEMVKHCGGLPLGVLVLGGILATKHSLKDWENVQKSIKSYLEKGKNIKKDQDGLQNILALSYNDLSYQLKPCFLYLSKYLEDIDIEIESLYQIWLAEGLISSDDRNGEEIMMDVAERYLKELAERCMVMVEMNVGPTITRFKSCRLHDLMRNMCLDKAKKENFLELIDYNSVERVESSSFSSRSIRRLAIHMHGRDDKKYVSPRKEMTKRLRSLDFSMDSFYEGRLKFQFDEFRMLRVLTIEGLGHDFDNTGWRATCVTVLDLIRISRAISELIHLRYLSLKRSDFYILPSYINKLKHLQTLDLRCRRILGIPNAIQKLEELKHLYLPYDEVQFCRFSLKGSHNLEILENFDSRYLDIKELSTLTKLRHLKAVVCNKLEDVEEFINQVNDLIYLRFFSLEIRRCDFHSEKGSTVLRKLFCLSRLHHLQMYQGRISKLPDYESCFLPNLRTLSVWGIRIEEDPMRTLEKLPNLRILHLLVDSFTGEEMICHASGFPQLRLLGLESLKNLSNWLINEGAMSNLSRLQILGCEKLKMIPDGLRFVSTLKELVITRMPEEFESRLQVKDGQEGEDFDKVRHVPSISFKNY